MMRGLGKFLSVDPLTAQYPELTPYQFSSNNPIQNIDIDGLEGGAATTVETTTKTKPVLDKTTQEAARRAADEAGRNGGRLAPKPKSPTWFDVLRRIPLSLSAVGFLTIEVFSSHDDPQKDLMEAYERARKRSFADPQVNQGLENEFLRNGFRNPTFERLGEDDDKYIYRGGNPGDANLTPRPEKDTKGEKRGLSTFTTAEKAKAASGKKTATKLSVNALRDLGFFLKYDGEHVSIRPATQAELDAWAATKQNAIDGKGSHVYTKMVQASVRGIQ